MSLEQDGFEIVSDVIEASLVEALCEQLRSASGTCGFRAGTAFGLRNLFEVVSFTRTVAESLKWLVEPVLGPNARVVRGIYFDKHKDANWKVAWHQDLTIAVRQRVDVPGYTAWSTKAGIVHVQPPVSVLDQMLTLRLHLDDTDESNGALRVMPGSHRVGRLSAAEIQAWRLKEVTTCSVRKGSALLMRPLLLHASSVALEPTHRRVLHFEYCSATLPQGLSWREE